MREMLTEAKQSGESLRAFAQRHGVAPQRLHFWRRNLDAVKGADSSTTIDELVPVFAASEASATLASGFLVVLGVGRVVRVGAAFDARASASLREREEGSPHLN